MTAWPVRRNEWVVNAQRCKSTRRAIAAGIRIAIDWTACGRHAGFAAPCELPRLLASTSNGIGSGLTVDLHDACTEGDLGGCCGQHSPQQGGYFFCSCNKKA